jgi:translation machinery-associated protein 16
MSDYTRQHRPGRKACSITVKFFSSLPPIQELTVTVVERVQFFKERAAKMEWDGLKQLVDDCIGRNSKELLELRENKREGRPPTSREQALAQSMDQEKAEFVGGFWVPDLTDEANVEALKHWNGEWAALSIIKFVRLTRDGEIKPASSFPNKG